MALQLNTNATNPKEPEPDIHETDFDPKSLKHLIICSEISINTLVPDLVYPRTRKIYNKPGLFGEPTSQTIFDKVKLSLDPEKPCMELFETYELEWRGIKDIQNKLPGKDLLQFHYSLTGLLNKTSCAVFWHENPSLTDQTDPLSQCGKNQHFHIVLIKPSSVLRMDNFSKYRTMREKLKTVDYKIKNITNHDPLVLLQYLLKPPRIFLGTNNIGLLRLIKEAMTANKSNTDLQNYFSENQDSTRKRKRSNTEEESEQSDQEQEQQETTPPEDNLAQMDPDTVILGPTITPTGELNIAHQKTTVGEVRTILEQFKQTPQSFTFVKKDKGPKMQQHKEVLLNLYKTYDTDNTQQILRMADISSPHFKQLTDLMLLQQFRRLETVCREYFHKQLGTYYQEFMKKTTETAFRDNRKYLSLELTTHAFGNWCGEQNIQPSNFLLEVYLVLKELGGKQNSFVLIGQPNGGKSFWIEPLMHIQHLVGRCGPDTKPFKFAPLIDKKIGYLNEVSLEQAEIETWKTLMEGLPTPISAKYKGQNLIPRMPIFYTANHEIWSYTQEDKQQQIKEAIRKRMFCHHIINSKELQALTEREKPKDAFANPYFYKRSFEVIEEFMSLPQSLPAHRYLMPKSHKYPTQTAKEYQQYMRTHLWETLMDYHDSEQDIDAQETDLETIPETDPETEDSSTETPSNTDKRTDKDTDQKHIENSNNESKSQTTENQTSTPMKNTKPMKDSSRPNTPTQTQDLHYVPHVEPSSNIDTENNRYIDISGSDDSN